MTLSDGTAHPFPLPAGLTGSQGPAGVRIAALLVDPASNEVVVRLTNGTEDLLTLPPLPRGPKYHGVAQVPPDATLPVLSLADGCHRHADMRGRPIESGRR